MAGIQKRLKIHFQVLLIYSYLSFNSIAVGICLLIFLCAVSLFPLDFEDIVTLDRCGV